MVAAPPLGHRRRLLDDCSAPAKGSAASAWDLPGGGVRVANRSRGGGEGTKGGGGRMRAESRACECFSYVRAIGLGFLFAG